MTIEGRRDELNRGRRHHQGQHICALYETNDEQLKVATEYIAEGLWNGERCLYVAQPREALERFRSSLAALGIDVVAAETRGALQVVNTQAAHLVDGHFDSERMLAMLNDAVESALDAGFKGLRTCGDMSWLLDTAPGGEQVVEYEGLLNGLFPSVRALGMCQYDRARLPPGLLDCAISTHPSVVIDGVHKSNPFYRVWPFDYGPGVTEDELKQKLSVLRAQAS